MPQKYFCWTFISFHEASSKSFHWYCSSDIFLLVTFISHFLGNLLKKLHISNTRLHTTSNFRRLKSCWINWSQVDSSQLVPPSTLLLLFLRGNLTISSAAAPQRKYRFPLWKPGFLSCCIKLCLWRADGDIRRLPHAAQCRKAENIKPNKQISPHIGTCFVDKPLQTCSAVLRLHQTLSSAQNKHETNCKNNEA